MDLTQQQISALQHGDIVPLTVHQTECVVVRKDVFEQLRHLQDDSDATEGKDVPWRLRLATSVYDGLSDAEIDEIEQIALDRGNFFRNGNGSAD